MEFALLGAALLLAFVNGANDNFKGVATLYGAGRLQYREALVLATISTAAGSLASVALAGGLIKAFSGKGLIPAEFLDSTYLTAVSIAAALTVLAATRIGMPISTTHAIVGALVGAGAVLAGSALNATALGAVFLLPLALGPLLAIALAWGTSRGGGAAGRALGLDASSCVCLGEDLEAHGAHVSTARATMRIQVAHADDCAGRNSSNAKGAIATREQKCHRPALVVRRNVGQGAIGLQLRRG